MKFFVIPIFGVISVFFASSSVAFACSCSATPTVLDEFARTPIVVAARLDSLEELDRSVAGTNVYRTMAAVMTVERSYKGSLKANQMFKILDGGGGDCGTPFAREKVGQRFLFYTEPGRVIGKLKGRLFLISRCSRSAKFDDAGPDLAYLDNRGKFIGKTRLSGTIKRFSSDPPSLANIKVAVTGTNFERAVETDEKGFFEFWDLPAGQYRVNFQVPSGTMIRDYKIVSLDKTWRRQVPADNTIITSIGVKKHTEIVVGVDSLRLGGQ